MSNKVQDVVSVNVPEVVSFDNGPSKMEQEQMLLLKQQEEQMLLQQQQQQQQQPRRGSASGVSTGPMGKKLKHADSKLLKWQHLSSHARFTRNSCLYLKSYRNF